MNYEDKTNRWIAIEVAKRLGERVSTVTEFHEGDGCVVYPHNNQINFDPCNNPSDAWPIILKYGISINFDGIDWEADTSWMGSESSNRSYNNIERNAGKPLRAAMICFLKMKDAEK